MSATYIKALGRYMLMTEHGQSFAGRLGLFEAKAPRGPWRTVFYGTLTDGTTRVPAKSFFFNFLPNGWRDSGKRFTLAFTGVQVLDALNLVDGRLTLNEAFR